MGRGEAALSAGGRIEGRYENGVFWYTATRPDGYRERFQFRWQATAFVNGWEPPASLHRYLLPRVNVSAPPAGRSEEPK